jgi:mycothiol synthase
MAPMEFCAPVPGDAPAVLALLAARDTADIGAPDYTLADLHDEWRASDFELTADALVVETEDGSMAGYAALLRTGTEAVVAPDHEGRGIGVRLLEWAERRDRERGRKQHRQWVAAGNARGRTLLLAAGYRPERSYWRMSRSLDDVAGGDLRPVDVAMRQLNVTADAEAVYALNEASFAANADYRPESYAAFCQEHLQAHDLDPELSCVLEQLDPPVGFLLARRWPDERVGFVDLLAVHPDHRDRGLGSAMLRTAFARFAAAGLREAQLGVASDNPRALRLYERCGMTPRFRFDTFERSLAAG